MTSLQQRIAVYANLSSNLLIQLNELDRLRDQVRQAQLATDSSLPVAQQKTTRVHGPLALRRRACADDRANQL
jgi:hypothetical protein